MTPEHFDWLFKTLRDSNLFNDFDDAQVREWMDWMEHRVFAEGDLVITEGEPGDWFMVVYRGKINVMKKKWPFGKNVVGHLSPGEFFGEISLFTGKPRTATLVVEQRLECFMMYKNSFYKLLDASPSFRQQIESWVHQHSN
ncbi:MAG: hypothetical protein COV67_08425 [Nitrospinae bacterium CG11_big_fil_rev_8_21_14_0_20_56_8]|nr:MAG: hypothetical protein COV67_08425 [Nitrospinae bacterium CG11_big_fil_rev_8_21_14_0_20_56_8]